MIDNLLEQVRIRHDEEVIALKTALFVLVEGERVIADTTADTVFVGQMREAQRLARLLADTVGASAVTNVPMSAAVEMLRAECGRGES